MVWLQRGLCGLDFKRQTNAIGALFLLLSFIAMVYGFVMMSNPEGIAGPSFFLDSTTTTTTTTPSGLNDSQIAANETISGNQTLVNALLNVDLTASESDLDRQKNEEIAVAQDEETADRIENGDIASDERKHYESVLRHIQNQGMELIIGSIISMILCVMLIIGSKQDKSIWFVPWMTEQAIGLVVLAVVGLSKLIGGRVQASAGFVVLFMILYIIFVLCTYAVMSHFMMLRKMKQHSRDIISSVMQGSGYQTGVNYDRLRDELGQARELQEVGPPTLRNGPDNSKKDDLLYFSI